MSIIYQQDIVMEDSIFCGGEKGAEWDNGLYISRNGKDPLYMDGAPTVTPAWTRCCPVLT